MHGLAGSRQSTSVTAFSAGHFGERRLSFGKARFRRLLDFKFKCLFAALDDNDTVSYLLNQQMTHHAGLPDPVSSFARLVNQSLRQLGVSLEIGGGKNQEFGCSGRARGYRALPTGFQRGLFGRRLGIQIARIADCLLHKR